MGGVLIGPRQWATYESLILGIVGEKKLKEGQERSESLNAMRCYKDPGCP